MHNPWVVHACKGRVKPLVFPPLLCDLSGIAPRGSQTVRKGEGLEVISMTALPGGSRCV